MEIFRGLIADLFDESKTIEETVGSMLDEVVESELLEENVRLSEKLNIAIDALSYYGNRMGSGGTARRALAKLRE